MGIRIALLLCCPLLASLAFTPALGQEILYCTDEGAQGFIWQNKIPRVAGFQPGRHTVKVVSKSERHIQYEGATTITGLACRGENPLTCVDGTGTQSWAFKGSNFTRANLFGENIGGNSRMYIAYGVCSSF
jgi:hypothetical protein